MISSEVAVACETRVGQCVALEVDAAALPGRAENLGDGGLYALVVVADDQLHATQAAPRQLAKKLGPDRFCLGSADFQTQTPGVFFEIEEAVLLSGNPFLTSDNALVASVVASQFSDYAFVSPATKVVLDPSTVDGDTGITNFVLSSGVWSLGRGAGSSLTDDDAPAALSLAGSGAEAVCFQQANGFYDDVTWTTKRSVPRRCRLL